MNTSNKVMEKKVIGKKALELKKTKKSLKSSPYTLKNDLKKFY